MLALHFQGRLHMETARQLIALLAIILGTLFSIVGILGLIRLPDVYTRLHATGKVGIFGVVLLLVAATVWIQLDWARTVLLIVLLMVAGPVIAHALASAAFRIRLRMENPERDDLKEAALQEKAKLAE
jgi:multicomponent Na+:H+ antiporter subunit G